MVGQSKIKASSYIAKDTYQVYINDGGFTEVVYENDVDDQRDTMSENGHAIDCEGFYCFDDS